MKIPFRNLIHKKIALKTYYKYIPKYAVSISLSGKLFTQNDLIIPYKYVISRKNFMRSLTLDLERNFIGQNPDNIQLIINTLIELNYSNITHLQIYLSNNVLGKNT